MARDADIAFAIAFFIPLMGSVLSSNVTSGLLIGVGGAVGAAPTSTVGGGAGEIREKIFIK